MHTLHCIYTIQYEALMNIQWCAFKFILAFGWIYDTRISYTISHWRKSYFPILLEVVVWLRIVFARYGLENLDVEFEWRTRNDNDIPFSPWVMNNIQLMQPGRTIEFHTRPLFCDGSLPGAHCSRPLLAFMFVFTMNNACVWVHRDS